MAKLQCFANQPVCELQGNTTSKSLMVFCSLQRVTLVPDPCTLLIDGVTVGFTSTDILFHMGAEEISW